MQEAKTGKTEPSTQVVEDVVIDDIEIDDVPDEAEAEALAEEVRYDSSAFSPCPTLVVRWGNTLTKHFTIQVGEITLDPPALPRELEDPQEVGVYINDIMRYMSRKEVRCRSVISLSRLLMLLPASP